MRKALAVLVAVTAIGATAFGGWFMGAELFNDGRVFSGLGYTGGLLTVSAYAGNLSNPLTTDWMLRTDATVKIGDGGFIFGLGMDAALDGWTSPDLSAFAYIGGKYNIDDLSFTLKAVASEALWNAWTEGGLSELWSELRISIGAEYHLDYLINELVALFQPIGYETGL